MFFGGSPMSGMSHLGFSSPSPTTTTATNDSVKFVRRLGQGVFGEVWKAEYEGKIVAAKTTGCPTGFRAQELELLKRAQGEHTVKLIAVEEGTVKGTAIIMELCDGNLQDLCKEQRSKEAFLAELEQILLGLVSLH